MSNSAEITSEKVLPIKPRPTRRTRAKQPKRKATIEERLLAAVERMLDQGHSFATLSIEQLTTEASMSRGTFYLHFKDKSELVARLMKVVTDELVVNIGTWLSDARRADRADIVAAVNGVAQTFRRHNTIVAAVSSLAPNDKAVAVLYDEMMDTIAQYCRRSISIVKRAGKSRPDVNDQVADALAWMVLMYLTRFAGEKSKAELEQMVDAIGYICVSAIFSDKA